MKIIFSFVLYYFTKTKQFSYLLIILLVASPSLLFPQNKPLKFDHYFKEDGIPQSSVISICQDSKGFMWFGTYGGLSRFDGINFKNFSYNENDTNSVSSYHIESIYTDREGNLWIGTDNGINVYNPEKENFTRIKCDVLNDIAAKHILITSFLEDSQNNFWITTLGGGLLLYNRNTGNCERIIFNCKEEDQNYCNTISHIIEDNDGVIWIATDNGLVEFNPVNKSTKFYRHNPKDPQSISINNVISLCADSKGNLWAGTWDGGLNNFNKETGKFKRYKNNQRDKNSIGQNIINEIVEDSRGNLWIATYGGGLAKFNYENETFINYRYANNVSTSISDNTVMFIYEDRAGLIWVGTEYGGLNVIDKYKNMFELYSENPSDHQSLTNNYIKSMTVDLNDNVWIGTWGGGINKFVPGTGTFYNYTYNANGKLLINNKLIQVLFPIVTIYYGLVQ